MGQTADQLREEIAAKRDDAAAKIDQIEARVQDLPHLARETVRGTVDASIQQAKDTVDQSLSQAREVVVDKVGTMKQQADLTTKIDERPLAALGIAFAGGYLLGKVLGGDDKHKSHSAQGTYRTDWNQAHSRAPHESGGHGAHDTQGASGSASNAGMGIGMGLASGAALHSSGATPGYAGAGGQQGQAQHQGMGGGIMGALKQAAQQAGLDDTLSSLSGALVATLTDQFNRTVEETFPDFAKHLKQQGGLGASGNRQGGGNQQSGGFQPSGGGSGSGGGMGSGSGSGMGAGGGVGGYSTGSGSSSEGLSGSGASGIGMGAGHHHGEGGSTSRDTYGQDESAGNNARTFGAGGEGSGADWKGPFASGASGQSVSEMPGDAASAGRADSPGATDVTGSRTPYYGGTSSSSGMGGTTP